MKGVNCRLFGMQRGSYSLLSAAEAIWTDAGQLCHFHGPRVHGSPSRVDCARIGEQCAYVTETIILMTFVTLMALG